jgi:hypothetical protein
MAEIRYELWYDSEGVSVTEYDHSDPDDPVVTEEWWLTWPELFAKITGIDDYSPEIHSNS